MADEVISTKEQWYDLTKYKDEIEEFIISKREELDYISNMEGMYKKLYASIFSGSNDGDEERFTHAQEMYKVYKASIIESSLSGYSALLEVSGDDGKSTLLSKKLKDVMTRQFKTMSLLEKLSGQTVDDWILKGEAISFIKLKQDKEEYRFTQTLSDATTGDPLMSFKMKEYVTYDHIDIERINPFDFYVDAQDYEDDPRGCVKIIRSWISPKELLTSNAYPLLTKEDKDNIISGVGRNGSYFAWATRSITNVNGRSSQTRAKRIEVLSFYGDYVTTDNKVLTNIKAVLIDNRIADLQYNPVSTNRIIYSCYKIDDTTHRGFSPISSTNTINNLVNRVTDMFINNLDDVSNPIMLAQKGSLSKQQWQNARRDRYCEYNNLDSKPDFWQPPLASQNGLALIELILNQNKNTLGLNSYMSGDNSGVVRTARESAIIFQKANARMRVETDVFSYNYMLRLFNSFYSFNRELALAGGIVLDDIYTNPELKVSISTNASRADKEGELQRLMQVLTTPIGQMIFSNLTPEQMILAVQYLMAKAELSDGDNILQLYDDVSKGIPVPYINQIRTVLSSNQQMNTNNNVNNQEGV